MWLINSSVGKKVVMSVSGIALILFLTFHMAMNIVALFSGEAYNMVCEFLGANWYALVGTMGLAALFMVHIVYAFILTMQNRSARGDTRYTVTDRPRNVEWASQNMLVLGLIVLLGLGLHFFNFWYRMQFNEITGILPLVNPHDGAGLIKEIFSNPAYVVVYLVWLGAIWFHLTHGFWSALHTIGWNNKIWLDRLQCIAKIYATLLVLGFAAVVIYFYLKSLYCCPVVS